VDGESSFPDGGGVGYSYVINGRGRWVSAMFVCVYHDEGAALY